MNMQDVDTLYSLEYKLKDYLNSKIDLEILSRDVRLLIDSVDSLLEAHVNMMRNSWVKIEETNAVWLDNLERGIDNQSIYKALREEAKLSVKDFLKLISGLISVNNYWGAYARVQTLALEVICDYACLLEIQTILPSMSSRKTIPYDLLGNMHNKYHDSLCLKVAHLFGPYRKKNGAGDIDQNIWGSHFKSLILHGTDDIKDKIRFETKSSSEDDIGLEQDFENTLLKISGVEKQVFEREIENLRVYRNKVLAHVDEHPDCLIPISETFYKMSCALIRCLSWISETYISGLRRFYDANIDTDKFLNNVREDFRVMIKNLAEELPD